MPKHNLIRTSLIIAWLGNLVDMVSTLYLHSIGFVEANPVMACLLNTPLVFTLVKIATMTLLLLYLWRKREDKHAAALAVLAAVIYGATTAYYVWFFMVVV